MLAEGANEIAPQRPLFSDWRLTWTTQASIVRASCRPHCAIPRSRACHFRWPDHQQSYAGDRNIEHLGGVGLLFLRRHELVRGRNRAGEPLPLALVGLVLAFPPGTKRFEITLRLIPGKTCSRGTIRRLPLRGNAQHKQGHCSSCRPPRRATPRSRSSPGSKARSTSKLMPPREMLRTRADSRLLSAAPASLNAVCKSAGKRHHTRRSSFPFCTARLPGRILSSQHLPPKDFGTLKHHGLGAERERFARSPRGA